MTPHPRRINPSAARNASRSEPQARPPEDSEADDSRGNPYDPKGDQTGDGYGQGDGDGVGCGDTLAMQSNPLTCRAHA